VLRQTPSPAVRVISADEKTSIQALRAHQPTPGATAERLRVEHRYAPLARLLQRVVNAEPNACGRGGWVVETGR
jgi:hypothetical protein